MCAEVNEQNHVTIDQSIADAVASVEMEGLHVDDDPKDWCRMLLRHEITLEQYLLHAKQSALDEADRAASMSDLRFSGEEVFARVRKNIHGGET